MAATTLDPPFPTLGDDVESALADVLPSEDPLDATDFDAVAYLNATFPNERSLPKLDPFIADTARQISRLDDEISRAVHAQAEAGERATRDIAAARAATAELEAKIALIKAKAEESEAIVRDVCSDIRELDAAKKNLQKTITALKRMHMLTSAIAQLRGAASERRYAEAANLLDAIGHLLRYFAPYGAVPRVAGLTNDVAAIRERLREEVFEAFERAAVLSETSTVDGFESGGFASLRDACLVVDAIGPAARERQVSAFVRRQLAPYAALFPKGGDASGLDEVDRRFAWIRRVLKAFRTAYASALPPSWRVEKRLVLGFCAKTREMLLEVLESGDGAQLGVAPVLKALQRALVFEKEQQQRFDDDEEEEKARAARREQAYDDGQPGDDDPAPADDAAAAEAAAARAADAELARAPLHGALSSVFDPFMDPYVDMEKQNMEDMLAKVTAEDQVDRDGALPVLASSVHLFAYIKTSVRRCTALTTGQTFYKLQRAFGDCLTAYAARLGGLLDDAPPDKALPGTTVGARALYEAARRAAEAADDEPPEGDAGPRAAATRDAEAACYALNTAEYCAETAGQLGDIVRGKVDATYRDRVDLEPVVDAFHDVIARAVARLVRTLEDALQPAFKQLQATNWGTLELVDEESSYVRDVVASLRHVAPRVRRLLSSLYFRNFCDKFAAAFWKRLHGLVRNARRISEMGTHQLLLDLHSLKPALLALPTVSDRDDGAPTGAAPPAYSRFVAKQAGRVEMLLKLVGTPADMLVERFKIMWPDGGADDLAAIAALKSMKKAEVARLLETFGATGAAAEAAAEKATRPRSKSPPPAGGATTASAVLRAGMSFTENFRKS